MRARASKSVALLGLVALGGSCSQNLLPDPEERAVSLPQAADVAVGATHDVLVVACQDKVTLSDYVFPVAATTLFVGLGRLDAAFYLPDALIKAAIPQCEAVDDTVSGAAFEGDAFELEGTPNPRAFKAHARREGEALFRAQVSVAGQALEVTSTLRAWTPDRVTFSPRCGLAPAGMTVLPGHVPAGGSAAFDHRLFHGSTALAGYGAIGVAHPRLVLSETAQGEVLGQVAPERGPFTVTSTLDPSFSLALTAYDVSDFDPPSLARVTGETVFVGETTSVLAPATIGGQLPCVAGFPRSVTIETPGVCRFKDRTDTFTLTTPGNAPLGLLALAEGTCRAVLTLPNSTQQASVEFPVFRAFETLAALPAAAVHPAITVTDLWLAGPDEAFVVGYRSFTDGRLESVTLRRTGGAWGPLGAMGVPRTLRAVHGSRADGAVFAAGRNGASWTGTGWSAFDAGTAEDLSDVWVNAANDVTAVGDNGTFVHFDGARWSPVDVGNTARLRGLWGDGSGAVYVVGWGGTARRWNGTTFTDLLPPGFRGTGFSPNAIHGSSPSDLWIVAAAEALHFDGGTWSAHTFGVQPGDAVTGVYAVGGGHAYALVRRGSRFFAERFDGARTVSIPVPGDARSITGIGNDVVVLTSTALVRYRHDPADVFP